MAARQQIGKKLRFEVFKRDGFKCQYCGACAPEAILHVDHIHPVSKGGDNDLMNLITSCQACNSGKSDIPLDDDTAIQKQRAMLDELSERRDQLEMMLAWRDGMKQIGETAVERIAAAWEEAVVGWHLNESGLKSVRTLLRTVPVTNILDAIDIAADRYLKRNSEGAITQESVELAWSKVPAIAKTSLLPDYERELLYIRGICRNRFAYISMVRCMQMLKEAYETGIDIDTLKGVAKEARSWSNWQDTMIDLMREG